METLVHDLRVSLRMLARNWGMTLTVLLTFALGIGANTAIFTVVYATLLAPLPYPHPDQLVMVWSKIQNSRDDVAAARLHRLEAAEHGLPGYLRMDRRQLQSRYQRPAGGRQPPTKKLPQCSR